MHYAVVLIFIVRMPYFTILKMRYVLLVYFEQAFVYVRKHTLYIKLYV